MKWLIYIVIVWLVWRIAKRWESQREHTPPPASSDQAAAERMVRCALCDVGLPVSEALSWDGRFYCGQEHLQQAMRPGDSAS